MTAPELTGLVRIRDHCLFAWRSSVDKPGHKLVFVQPQHCAACIEALKSALGRSITLVFRAANDP